MSLVTARNNDQFAGPGYVPVAGGGAGPLLGWAKRITRRAAIHRQRQALRALPDWTLKDIGINRSDIDSISVNLVDDRLDPTLRRTFR
jgi:hypothetical protein